MGELKKAIEQQKMIYVFIQKDVLVENRIYLKNKDDAHFLPTVVDDIRIYQFIDDLRLSRKEALQ